MSINRTPRAKVAASRRTACSADSASTDMPASAGLLVTARRSLAAISGQLRSSQSARVRTLVWAALSPYRAP